MSADDGPVVHPAFGYRNETGWWVDSGLPMNDMGVNVGDIGQLGVKLPGTAWMLVCGPSFARALAGALNAAADSSDDVIAKLIAGAN